MSREHSILVGQLVYAMDKQFHEEIERGRRPTQKQFFRAIDLACAYFKSIGYIFDKDDGLRENREIEYDAEPRVSFERDNDGDLMIEIGRVHYTRKLALALAQRITELANETTGGL